MTDNTSPERFGWLCWWSIPEVTVPYTQLLDWADECAYPTSFVPGPPSPRHAWQSATGTGKRGVEITPDANLVAEFERQHGVKPRVYLRTVSIKGTQPVLVRHLVRFAIGASDEVDVGAQLDLGTVAVLEFDCMAGLRGTARSRIEPDPRGYANGAVSALVETMHQRMEQHATHAGGQEVRRGIRRCLGSLHRVALRGTGGVYFVPGRVGYRAVTELQAMRNWIRGLRRWKTGVRFPSCDIVTIRGQAAFNEISDTVRESALDEFRTRLQRMRDRVAPVTAGRSTGQTARRINATAIAEWMDMIEGLEVYQGILGPGDDSLAMLLQPLAMDVAALLKVSAGMAWDDHKADPALIMDETIRRVF